jgi:hypothetical protein
MIKLLEILPSSEQNNPPLIGEFISILGEVAMLERIGHLSTSIELTLSIERRQFPQAVSKVEKNEHMLQTNKSAHQYFHTSPPTPPRGQV